MGESAVTPELAVLVYNRLAFGPGPGDLAAFRALASDDGARLSAWLDQQLAPESMADPAVDQKVAEAGFETINKPFDQLWEEHHVNPGHWTVLFQPLFETRDLTFLRAIYSQRQLQEVMVEFWHNHFSVYSDEARPLFLHYDRDVLRPEVFGNFRVMLEAVTKSPAMMWYLDQNRNRYQTWRENDGLNENFSRELLELHALGAEAFFVSTPADQVPKGNDGIAVGYTDDDVTVAARCLSGWIISDSPGNEEIGNTGHFLYRHELHDTDNDKLFMGRLLTARDESDGQILLDMLAEHPATARFIATKLCRRLIADDPPDEVVNQAAATWRAHVDSPDQIALTLRTIILSQAFRSTWGEKVKRPFQLAVSALRATQADVPFDANWWFKGDLYERVELAGNFPFEWHPPDGYPDRKEAWTTTSPQVFGWRLLNWLVNVRAAEGAPRYMTDLWGQTPDSSSASEAIDFWIDRIFGRALPDNERTPIVEFLANGAPASAPLDLSSESSADSARLRAAIGLLLMTPTFLCK